MGLSRSKMSPSPFSYESAVEPLLPDELHSYCRELLRTYVIMGSGNLGDELKAWPNCWSTPDSPPAKPCNSISKSWKR